MSFVRRIFLALVPAALLMVAGIMAPSAQAEAPAAPAAVAFDTQTGQALDQWECSIGHVCFWNKFDGKGDRCMWENKDDDWNSNPVRCSWAGSKEVKSVYNRGTSSQFTGVAFYGNTGFHDRIGCTRQGQKGDLTGTYKVKSHQWITTRCG